MFEIIGQFVMWILCTYGLISIIRDLANCNNNKKVEENIRLVMTVKNVENGIEEYIRELSLGKNFYNSLIVIDQNSEDDTINILKKLEKEKFNMKVLNREEGEKYFIEMMQKI